MPRPSDQQRAATEAGFGAGNTGATPSADILTEDVDQALLHFSAAVKEHNQPVLTRTVLFMNELLTSSAWRSKRYREEEESFNAALASLNGRGHGGSTAGPAHTGTLHGGGPSLTQWVDALESLTAAGLPTALQYLRDLYKTSTAWTEVDRRCSIAVLNFIFFVLVLFRQTQRRVASLRLHQQNQVTQPQQQQQQWTSAAASPSSTITPFLFEASHTALPAPSFCEEGRALDVVEVRIASLYQAQQTIVMPYLCFISWNAEAQLHAVNIRASVCIKGMPSLSELPQVPLYLSEYDGWIWVWMTVALYSALSLPGTPRAQPSSMHNVRAAPSSPDPGGASVATTSVGSPPPAAVTRPHGFYFSASPQSSPLARRDSTSFAGRGAETAGAAPGSHGSSRHRGVGGGVGGAAGSVDDALNGGGGVGASRKKPSVRSAVVRLLLQMSPHDGGDLYMHKMVAVLFSSFELLLHHWTRGQPVIGDLLREWTQRVVHSRLSPHLASLTRLRAWLDLILDGSLEELTRVVVTLDDVVLHTSFLFFSSTRPLLRLHQLLEQLVPLQVTLLFLYQLHLEAHRSAEEDERDDEVVGTYRFPLEDADEVYGSDGARSRWTEQRRTRTHELCAGDVLRYCTAVSQLLAHVAELLLEPHTQRTNGFNAFQLPQSLCCAMLKNTMMFMASEMMLNEEFWVSVRGGGGGRDGGRGGGSAMRKQWRWWSVWTNTAHFVCVTGGRFGEPEESDADLLYHQRRRDVFYVQAISLAMEDVYALLQMIASTDMQQSVTAPRTLHLIFLRLRAFFVRLHEEHVAAISLHVVSPFSALRDDTFNAFAQLLEHYVAVTAMERVPFLASTDPLNGANPLPPPFFSSPSTPLHRSLWLLAVAYLRLATINSSATQDGDAAPPDSAHPVQHAEEQPTTSSQTSARRRALSTHNFVCATPFASLFYLRDRSYESSEDWMQQTEKWQKKILLRNGKEVPQLRDSAHLFRCYRGEVQQNEDAARELLLLASVRWLSAALCAASRAHVMGETERLSRSTSSFTNARASPRGTESQSSIYVTAFSRYLCMAKDISSPCLLFLLQIIRDELRGCKEREGSTHHSNASAITGEGGNWLGEQDLLDARAFECEVSLYSV
ncbi:hypothetical protein ABB37_00020 [Leptomonas pyrrhocoris]|uniref:Uncharacterized protein n=1 Tax=Leptomonas pyrrhocoris TaxID=157538 RepID=A0A0N0VHK3_LEPPY|nr:hypothetical protein ABB37_00020 [Leptomonas pyrrhocoris]KPA85614.1 hypothetical protein ABB37_00020 [Leptomonas pyrrhocoris]|eukprot:XP_015664053.1 hypothetical protein ABB37_00020 [Leptomonas pyrrhocoris]